MRVPLVLLLAGLSAVTGAGVVVATAAPSADSRRCVEAAQGAASRHGVPVRVMRAIALVESRRPNRREASPWPWTLNVAGRGFWFDSRGAALAHARRALTNGEASIDLGCFQINYRWHGAAFADLGQMLDPEPGADYAARFLRELYNEAGNWLAAAGLYHSRRPADAKRYRQLVAQAMAEMPGTLLSVLPPAALRAASAPGAGSLWPASVPGAGAGLSAGAVGTGMLRRAGGRLVDTGS